MNENDRIVFFYPSTLAVGGTEVLFSRMALKLSERGRDVAVIDYKDGFIAKNTIDGKVELIEYHRSKQITVPPGSCVVSPFSFVAKICHDLALVDDVRILFWCIHPHNLIWNFHLWNYFKHLRSSEIHKLLRKVYPKTIRALNSVLGRLHRMGGIIFMDEPNRVCHANVLGIRFPKPKYVPIPIPGKCLIEKPRKKFTSGKYDIVWLGRLCVDKIYALNYILQEVERYVIQSGNKVTFHIIGRGEYENQFKERAENSRVKVKFVGTMLREELDDYLVTQGDILFATGTSCLEGAQLGIPSVLVDPSFNVYPDTYRFTWLFERRDFSLGEFVNDSSAYDRGHTIHELFEAIVSGEVGTRCLEYTALNHNQDKIVNELDAAVGRAQYTLRELYTDPEYWRIEFWNPFSRILANCFYQFDTEFSSLEDLLSQIQKNLVSEGRKKLALYGSGGHTEKLIQHLRPVEGLEFVAVLDSNPIKHGKWYFDLPVMSLAEAVDRLGVDCVLISSLSFEEEIFTENEDYCKKHGISLQKLYGYEDYRFSTMIWDIIGY